MGAGLWISGRREELGRRGEVSHLQRGILECHTQGVVTSTSLMVTGRAVHEAVSMSRDHPALAIGLHWDVQGEGERSFDTEDLAAVRDEFRRQLDEFHRLMGRELGIRLASFADYVSSTRC